MLGTKKNTLGWKPNKLKFKSYILLVIIPQNKKCRGWISGNFPCEFKCPRRTFGIFHRFSFQIPVGGTSGTNFCWPTLGHPNVGGRFMYSLPIARVFFGIYRVLPTHTCSQWTSARACPNIWYRTSRCHVKNNKSTYTETTGARIGPVKNLEIFKNDHVFSVYHPKRCDLVLEISTFIKSLYTKIPHSAKILT